MHTTGSVRNPQQMTQWGDYAINLHIDELVLHNFAPGDRHAIASALERELTRLFAAEGVPLGLAQTDGAARLDGGSFNVPRNAAPDIIGAHLARAVYQNLAGPSSTRQASGANGR
jgi:hypothetical protein